MNAITDELGTEALGTADFAFSRQHFDHSTEVSEQLANRNVPSDTAGDAATTV